MKPLSEVEKLSVDQRQEINQQSQVLYIRLGYGTSARLYQLPKEIGSRETWVRQATCSAPIRVY